MRSGESPVSEPPPTSVFVFSKEKAWPAGEGRYRIHLSGGKEVVIPAARVKEFLEAARIPYLWILHGPAYTTEGAAASAHARGRETAKAVVVKVDGRPALAVLPSTYRLDTTVLRERSGAGSVSLAEEADFLDLFSDCEPGAIPPFGNLYGMEVYLDRRLTESSRIILNAGTHRELVEVAVEDFLRSVAPRVVDLRET